jgi:hypothetical protein
VKKEEHYKHFKVSTVERLLTVMILENIERKYLRNIPAFEYFKFFQGS